jgi:hypothetical protein
MNKLLVLLLLLTGVTVYAQQGSVQDATFDVVVVGNLELQPANRFFEQNSDVQPEPNVKSQSYDTKDYTINPPRFDAKVVIPKMPDDSLKELYANYVKVGYGNYNTPFLDAYFHNKRSKTWSYGAHLKHYSSSKGVLNNSGNSQQLAELFGSRYGKVNSWSSHLSYSRNKYFYYGLPQDLAVDKDSIKQVYQLIHGGISTKKILVGKDFNYGTGLDLFYLNTTSKASELEVLWNGNGAYKVTDERSVLLETSLSYVSKSDSASLSRVLFTFKPIYKITKDEFVLKVGATVNYSSDTLKGSDGVHLYPYGRLDYFLQPNKLTLFVGLGGEIQKNTYRSFIQANPYLGANPVIAHTNNMIAFYMGAKGNLSKKVNYTAQLQYASYKNQYFFTNSITDSSRFEVVYDNGNTNLFGLKGQMFYDMSTKWRAFVSAELNKWTTDNLEKAWHRPSFIGTAGVSYNASNKILINSELYYIGGLKGWNRESNTLVDLKNIIDLSLKVDYRFSSDFSAFIEFNNILAQKYQRYLYYTNKSVNVLAGLTYSF